VGGLPAFAVPGVPGLPPAPRAAGKHPALVGKASAGLLVSGSGPGGIWGCVPRVSWWVRGSAGVRRRRERGGRFPPWRLPEGRGMPGCGGARRCARESWWRSRN